MVPLRVLNLDGCVWNPFKDVSELPSSTCNFRFINFLPKCAYVWLNCPFGCTGRLSYFWDGLADRALDFGVPAQSFLVSWRVEGRDSTEATVPSWPCASRLRMCGSKEPLREAVFSRNIEAYISDWFVSLRFELIFFECTYRYSFVIKPRTVCSRSLCFCYRFDYLNMLWTFIYVNIFNLL